MKKCCFIIMVCCLCFVMKANAASYDFEVDGIRYTINKRAPGTCSVSPKTDGWSSFSRYEGDIVIPRTVVNEDNIYTVTEIERDAFWSSNITSVSIPISVTTIGSSAFGGCFKLTEVYNHAVVPQEIEMSTFLAAVKDMNLHVYEGYKSVYENASNWAYFKIHDDIRINKVKSISLNKDYCFCSQYHSSNLSATIEPADASIQELKWESSNEGVAYITQEGKVIGAKEGTAIITVRATDGSGIYAQCKVEVAGSGGVVSDYNDYLSASTTSVSGVQIGSYYRATYGFYISNFGPDCVYITKVECNNANTDETVSTITKKDVLGWLADGEKKNLSVTLDKNIPLEYEIYYTYKDKEFVFNSKFDSKVGIDNVSTTETNNVPEIYDVNGKKIESYQKGINVVKYNDGSVKKIMIK